ncbi:MAG: ATP-binding protein [Nannocystaceae bacterium]|nr:PAS domain S-box protein [Myxococcales bacterium]
MNLRELLRGPRFEDEEKTRVAGVLNLVLLLSASISLALPLLQLTVSREIVTSTFQLLFIAGFSLALVALSRSGRVYAAGFIWVMTMWAVINYTALGYGGIRSPAISTNILIVMVVTLLFGGRVLVAFIVLMLLTLFGVYVFDVSGALPPRAAPDTPELALINYCVQFIFAGYFLYLTVTSLHGALMRARRTESETARLLTEATRAKRYVDNIFNSMAETLIVLDAEARIRSINPAAARLLGYAADELVGTSFSRIVTASGDPKHARAWLERLRTDEISHAEFLYRTRDGDEIPVLFSSALILDEAGDVAEIVCAASDITLRKQAEERLLEAKEMAEEANMAKSRFLANMSHELRTPLNAVIGYSEMILEELADGQQTAPDDVERIRQAGKHLLTLISDILDLSKIEAGRMELFREPIDVAGVVTGVIDTIRPMLSNNGNTLRSTVPRDLGTMYSDETKLRQVLLNLLSNAAKFTSNGLVEVKVERFESDEGTWFVFKVKDDGIGMTRAQMDRLFQPFVQADSSTSRRYGGTGLGLAICRVFVEMMGGAIDVESRLHKGSTFTVHLPASAPEQSGLRAPPRPPSRAYPIVSADV